MVRKDQAFHRSTASASDHIDAWKPAEITPLDDGRGPLLDAVRAIQRINAAGGDARVRYFDDGNYAYYLDGDIVSVTTILMRAKGL